MKLEKHQQNSIATPQITFSFLQFRLYTSIQINCKITSLTNTNWFAYEMIESSEATEDDEQYAELPDSASEFSSRFYKFKQITGLTYTSNSEDITFKPRFFKLGLHLICINVAMLNVDELDATDCVYVQVSLPPIVAGINYGVGRSVHHGDVILMDAVSASYDPDIQTLEDVQDPSYNSQSSKLNFLMSCPFLVEPDSIDAMDSSEKALMFENNRGDL